MIRENFLEEINVLLVFVFRRFLDFCFSISIIETDFLLRKTIVFDFDLVLIAEDVRDFDLDSSVLR